MNTSKEHSAIYPGTYRSVGDVTEVDTFAVHQMFQINDHSGCLQSASTKLLMSSASCHTFRDIREARDTLTRWLQLNQELNT